MVKKKRIIRLWIGLLLTVLLCTACTLGGNQGENTPEPTKKAQSSEKSAEPGTVTARPIVDLDMEAAAKLADGQLKKMSLEEKVGQIFIVNFELLDDGKGNYYEHRKITKRMKENISKYHVGGVVFFSRNIEKRKQTIKFITKLQENTQIPLFITVDEEGGDVARIGSNTNMRTTTFPTMESIGKEKDGAYAYDMGATIAREIRELGFNVDFAPVADVRTSELNTEIGSRSFGADPDLVADMASNVVKGLQDGGISATLKHFPGHGDAKEDSHEGSVNVDNSISRMRKVDFVPFQKGIKAGADFIMVSHISVSRVTESTTPASLSSLIMQDILREEMNFNGVIITDAMDMQAITDKYTCEKATLQSFKAGADIILMPENLEVAYNTILNAVKSGEMKESRLNESVKRILTVKYKRGILVEE